MHTVPPPHPRDLLPPLLACLPTAFASPRPPPALFPLLSPVLRQRLKYLGDGAPEDGGWLTLLSWNQNQAEQLPIAVKQMQIEPHPVSGEVELNDVQPAQYRYLDKETLQARIQIDQFNLQSIWVWCENDVHGETGPGWKLAELGVLSESKADLEWFDSPSKAETALLDQGKNGDDSAEDDYWASYDRSTADTPAKKPSPNIQTGAKIHPQSELEYFARYENVQPALDAHDPDEERVDIGQSTLRGDLLSQLKAQRTQADKSVNIGVDRESGISEPGPDINSPWKYAAALEALERQAQVMDDHDRTHGIVKRHIQAQLQSMLALSRDLGLNWDDFSGIVRSELDDMGKLATDKKAT
ncbi:hypothetical protein K470DRAFT_216535 [Piedraia hortae CBS 480.64]|uniref:Uncharacterized protein n=1 Tax=Piedraia hortae CBS 480.64 TaxID=1314780 RepID=A0A6A7BZU4_9PEZI|nr:hypothetical protein K470DRAFT_216535 [Piedraia hortae CBS 480.64]